MAADRRRMVDEAINVARRRGLGRHSTDIEEMDRLSEIKAAGPRPGMIPSGPREQQPGSAPSIGRKLVGLGDIARKWAGSDRFDEFPSERHLIAGLARDDPQWEEAWGRGYGDPNIPPMGDHWSPMSLNASGLEEMIARQRMSAQPEMPQREITPIVPEYGGRQVNPGAPDLGSQNVMGLTPDEMFLLRLINRPGPQIGM